MERIRKIVYRNLTNAEFFNINKPPGMETGGGGQGYIDFPVRTISVQQWYDFFTGIIDVVIEPKTKGPSWTFPIYSIGIDDSKSDKIQSITIYQRRRQSVSITSQKLLSSKSNRIRAWNPAHQFPIPVDNTDRTQCPAGLMVYLASTDSGKVWAGWYLNDGTTELPVRGTLSKKITQMFSYESGIGGASGIIEFTDLDNLYLIPENHQYPLQLQGDSTYVSNTPNPVINESEHIDTMFLNDTYPEYTGSASKLVLIKKRNKGLVNKLKALYNNKCQITGDTFSFQKKDGVNYTEVHHLIPLVILPTNNGHMAKRGSAFQIVPG
ncbi:HNH endonuclease [Yersinia hibernica]|uniref:HNH endonuclease n=1 Tax=Yersinia enterocolitica LC20 TaxID=1443113 RepID=A0A7U4GIU9_YEREN|nr:HNH endonuclease [Yersinia hibernica]AHM76348.2 HNH endonuclease [Yersinia hibernica]